MRLLHLGWPIPLSDALWQTPLLFSLSYACQMYRSEGCQKNYKHKSIFEISGVRPLNSSHIKTLGNNQYAEQPFTRNTRATITIHRKKCLNKFSAIFRHSSFLWGWRNIRTPHLGAMWWFWGEVSKTWWFPFHQEIILVRLFFIHWYRVFQKDYFMFSLNRSCLSLCFVQRNVFLNLINKVIQRTK